MGVVVAMEQKNYQDLKKEIWETGRCSGCGGCVAICPADAITFRESGDTSTPVQSGYCKQVTDGVACGACYAVCPRTVSQATETLGNYIDLLAAKTTRDIARRQSGGAVTGILAHALDTGMIDAVVTIGEDRFTLRPVSVVITSREQLVHEAGSRYSWWVPFLAALKTAVVNRKYNKIAIVGVPCAVQAVSRIRTSDHDLLQPYARSIRLVIGLFCTESFDYAALIGKKLRSEHNIATWEIKKLDVRGKLEVTMKDGSAFSFPLKELDETVRTGCHHCTDTTALFSDISAGSVGSPEGYTTLIVRNLIGKSFLESAVQAGDLVVSKDIDPGAIEKLALAKIQKNSIN
jgi:coenzyme F420 hydrogenase subunit beta